MKKVLIGVALVAAMFAACGGTDTGLAKLRVEYREQPLGIDFAQPRFSWQMTSIERGAAQVAYQIVVTDADGKEVWNTGRVESGVALGIKYAGEALKPGTRYTWTLTSWDNQGKELKDKSWFETGLMSQTDTDEIWGGAKWIGGDNSNALTFYSQYLPVFRAKFSVALDEATKATEAGFIYGANDHRLMDKNKNVLGVEAAKDESYIKVALNTAGLDKGGQATVEVYRAGYAQTDDAAKPFASFAIPASLVNKANRYAKHTIEVASMHGTTDIWVDGAAQPVAAQFNLNPMGVGGDYISFPQVGDVGFAVAEGQKAAFSDVEIQNYRAPRATVSAIAAREVSGEKVIFTPEETGAPMLRTEFTAEKNVASARIYATARGIYELFMNGERVGGEDWLNPGHTQYNKTQFYQTYDVTSLVKKGENALGAQLNEGWYSGALSFSGFNWNFFGDKQSLLAKLVVTYSDGTSTTVVTDPASWQFYNDGPVRLGSLFQGEVYDATREEAVEGWTKPGFNAEGWTAAVEVPLEGTIAHEQLEGFFAWPCPDDYSNFTLTAQVGQPVRVNTVIKSAAAEEVRPGVFVYDMKQNMAGVPRIKFTGLEKGTKVYMRYAEVKYPDLKEYDGNIGMVMMENQRGAMEQDIYIAKGGKEEIFEPRGTYHGYQYVEITGVPSATNVASVEGIVLSSVDEFAAEYTSSDETLNRFFENVKWSTRANVFSIPTDCPQRNERMGWSGDLSVFSPAMSYLFNGAPFLRTHLLALRDTQEPDGAYPAVAPVGGGFGGMLWSSVGVAMPWQSYLQYGDIDAIAEHYPSMQKYVDELLLNKYIDASGVVIGIQGVNLGDWLGFEVGKNDNTLIFDCYLVYELNIMEGIANALGKTDDATRYAAERAKRIQFINDNYLYDESLKTMGTGKGPAGVGPFGMAFGSKKKNELIDTQTSYALPAALGIVDEAKREKFVENFVNAVERKSVGDDGTEYPEFSLMTGFIGTAWIANGLSEVGRGDLAYRMLLNRQFPSWLYPVEQGATTIWERLNSYTKDNGFGGNNSMNSFNHYAFGSVTNWLMQNSLGIARDEAAPGFKHFFLRPEVDTTGGLTFARGHYDSMYGRISSSWEIKGDAVEYNFIVPANTSATLCIPASSLEKIEKDGAEFTLADGMAVAELVAGKYKIVVKK